MPAGGAVGAARRAPDRMCRCGGGPTAQPSDCHPAAPCLPTKQLPLQQACKAKTLDAVVVATDDERIAEACRAAGARVVMTHPDCANGAPPPSPASPAWERAVARAWRRGAPCACRGWCRCSCCHRRGAAMQRCAPRRAANLACWLRRAIPPAPHARPLSPRCRLPLVFTAGTERCEEAVSKLRQRYDIVVNIQARWARCGRAAPRPPMLAVCSAGCWAGRGGAGMRKPAQACATSPLAWAAKPRAPRPRGALHGPARRCRPLAAPLPPLTRAARALPQGDEPLIEPECIDAVVRALQDSPDAVYRWGRGRGALAPAAAGVLVLCRQCRCCGGGGMAGCATRCSGSESSPLPRLLAMPWVALGRPRRAPTWRKVKTAS